MTFDYPGYPLLFIQRDRCNDLTPHQFTYIYKFFSPVTKYHYIVRAEQHSGNIFAIKFYCKKDRRSDFKYSKIINRGDLGNIIMSCAKIIPILLQQFPQASFAFAASRSVDKSNRTIEDYEQTQRFRLYEYMIRRKFGQYVFEHVAYDIVSSYLLYNRQSFVTRHDIENMFQQTYQNLYEINV